MCVCGMYVCVYVCMCKEWQRCPAPMKKVSAQLSCATDELPITSKFTCPKNLLLFPEKKIEREREKVRVRENEKEKEGERMKERACKRELEGGMK